MSSTPLPGRALSSSSTRTLSLLIASAFHCSIAVLATLATLHTNINVVRTLSLRVPLRPASRMARMSIEQSKTSADAYSKTLCCCTAVIGDSKRRDFVLFVKLSSVPDMGCALDAQAGAGGRAGWRRERPRPHWALEPCPFRIRGSCTSPHSSRPARPPPVCAVQWSRTAIGPTPPRMHAPTAREPRCARAPA